MIYKTCPNSDVDLSCWNSNKDDNENPDGLLDFKVRGEADFVRYRKFVEVIDSIMGGDTACISTSGDCHQ